jgi:hypothetical protein
MAGKGCREDGKLRRRGSLVLGRGWPLLWMWPPPIVEGVCKLGFCHFSTNVIGLSKLSKSVRGLTKKMNWIEGIRLLIKDITHKMINEIRKW